MNKKTRSLAAVICALLLSLWTGAGAHAATGEEGQEQTVSASVPARIHLDIGDHGKVIVDGVEYAGETIIRRYHGDVEYYTFEPDEGYEIDQMIYNSQDMTEYVYLDLWMPGWTYVAYELTGDATLSVRFKPVPPTDTPTDEPTGTPTATPTTSGPTNTPTGKATTPGKKGTSVTGRSTSPVARANALAWTGSAGVSSLWLALGLVGAGSLAMAVSRKARESRTE